MNLDFDRQRFMNAAAHANSAFQSTETVLRGCAGDFVPSSALIETVDALQTFLMHARLLKEAYETLPSQLKDGGIPRIRDVKKKVNDAHKRNERLTKRVKSLQRKLQRTTKRIKLLQKPRYTDETPHVKVSAISRHSSISEAKHQPSTGSWECLDSNSLVDSWPSRHGSLMESSSPAARQSVETLVSSKEVIDSEPCDLSSSSCKSEESQFEDISYVHSGRENAITGKPRSSFVRQHEHEGVATLQVREPAYAQVFKDDVLISSKFVVESPFTLGKLGSPTFSYIGFRYIDETTLPFIPVKNVRLLYYNPGAEPYPDIVKERPGKCQYAHTHILVALEEKVFDAIVDMSICAFRESRKERERATEIQRPQCEAYAYDADLVSVLVHMNADSYVRVADEREDVAIGLISSVMHDRQSDIKGDATFYLRFASFEDGVPVLCFKLHGIKVNAKEYE
ncbi:hypothetical protein FGB62_227g09 [Gracilaria domingensis]|nr:hypothetical protein FGB62_227g09 [Gracilaria domingensis]